MKYPMGPADKIHIDGIEVKEPLKLSVYPERHFPAEILTYNGNSINPITKDIIRLTIKLRPVQEEFLQLKSDEPHQIKVRDIMFPYAKLKEMEWDSAPYNDKTGVLTLRFIANEIRGRLAKGGIISKKTKDAIDAIAPGELYPQLKEKRLKTTLKEYLKPAAKTKSVEDFFLILEECPYCKQAGLPSNIWFTKKDVDYKQCELCGAFVYRDKYFNKELKGKNIFKI